MEFKLAHRRACGRTRPAPQRRDPAPWGAPKNGRCRQGLIKDNDALITATFMPSKTCNAMTARPEAQLGRPKLRA